MGRTRLNLRCSRRGEPGGRYAFACVLFVMCALPAGAAVQDDWFDDFESYPLGPICGKGGWEEPGGGGLGCAVVTDERAFRGRQSLKINGSQEEGRRALRRFEVKDGQWTMSMMTYVPRDAEGEGWVIMLNQYPRYNWSLQVVFDADLDLVANGGRTDGETRLIRDRWVEFRVEIDLDGDRADYFYNDELFVQATWTEEVSGKGEPWIQALDLYGGKSVGITGMFFDDTSLTANQCEPCDANCDGSVDLTDVEPFLDVILGRTEEEPCDGCVADINGDGSIDLSDIEGFIECLLGP